MSIDPYTIKLVGAGCAVSASALAFVAFSRARAVAQVHGEAGAAEADGRGVLRRLVSPIAVGLRPDNQAELEQLTTLLLTAGRRTRDAVDRYCEERVLVLFGGVALAVLAALGVGGMFGLLLSLIALLVGVIGPRKHLEMRAAARRDAIAQALPPAVDLLTTCVDAGLSLEQSVARVSRELAAPILADELRTTAKEFEAGVALPDALRRLARRVGLDDLSALCGVIAQAHGLGAPIGNTLRDYAQSARRQRMSLLEERAGKLAAQLTMPLALCLLPAAMMIILGPAIVQLVRAFQ